MEPKFLFNLNLYIFLVYIVKYSFPEIHLMPDGKLIFFLVFYFNNWPLTDPLKKKTKKKNETKRKETPLILHCLGWHMLIRPINMTDIWLDRVFNFWKKTDYFAFNSWNEFCRQWALKVIFFKLAAWKLKKNKIIKFKKKPLKIMNWFIDNKLKKTFFQVNASQWEEKEAS